jgi:hypothetical protein
MVYGGIAACFAAAAGVYAFSTMDRPASAEVDAVRTDVRRFLPLTEELMAAAPKGGPATYFLDPDQTLKDAHTIGRETDLVRACAKLGSLRALHQSAMLGYLTQGSGKGNVDIRAHTRLLATSLPSDRACTGKPLRAP